MSSPHQILLSVPEATTRAHRQAVYSAIINNNVDKLKTALNLVPFENKRDFYSQTTFLNGEGFLHIAAGAAASPEILGHLLGEMKKFGLGDAINSKSIAGNTPLHCAAAGSFRSEDYTGKSHTEAVKFLIKNGAECADMNGSGYTPLHLAVLAVHPTSKPVNSEMVMALLFGVKERVISQATSLGQQPQTALLEAPTPNGETALFAAIWIGDAALTSLLLDYDPSANPNAKNAQNETPAHFAAAHKSPVFLAELAERGADLSVRSDDGEYPLSIALKKMNEDSVRYLLHRTKSNKDPEYNKIYKEAEALFPQKQSTAVSPSPNISKSNTPLPAKKYGHEK